MYIQFIYIYIVFANPNDDVFVLTQISVRIPGQSMANYVAAIYVVAKWNGAVMMFLKTE